MKIFYLLIFAFGFSIISAQDNSDVKTFQKELNEQYKDSVESPLPKDKIAGFTEHVFYPIDEKYKVEAKFIRTKKAKSFKMPTSGSRTPVYKKYGEAHFEIDGKSYVLALYQNQGHLKHEEYKNYLFVPFNDKTNGEETYVAGRYIDVLIPEGKTITLNFNMAYNPYCAYNYKYSCPIPPEENNLDVEIKAGIKFTKKED
jgi:uncharacterized protein (DUF1684 family)